MVTTDEGASAAETTFGCSFVLLLCAFILQLTRLMRAPSSAYAELHFTHRMWPEFQASDLEAAVRDYHGRQRRFGAVPEAAAV